MLNNLQKLLQFTKKSDVKKVVETFNITGKGNKNAIGKYKISQIIQSELIYFTYLIFLPILENKYMYTQLCLIRDSSV